MSNLKIKTAREGEGITRFLKYIVEKILIRLSTTHLENRYPQIAIVAFDYVGLTISLEGRFENHILSLLERVFACYLPDSLRLVALDVGANIGNHSIFFSKYFNRVYSFEPNEKVFDLLSYNAKWLGEGGKIVPMNFGLGGSCGSVKFSFDPGNLGGGRVIDRCRNHSGIVREIQIRRVDDLTELTYERVGLIKIDTEGFETEVLNGALKIIKRDRPLILFEVQKEEIELGTCSAMEFLKNEGYTFFTIRPNFYLGESSLSRLASFALRLLFGKTYELRENDKIQSCFHELVVAFHSEWRKDSH